MEAYRDIPACVLETLSRTLLPNEDGNVSEEALELLRIVHQRGMQYDSVNADIKRLQPDFPSLVTMIDSDVEHATVKLLDSVLGDQIASYFLYEASRMKDGGSITELDGVVWPIRCFADVEAYVARPR